MKRIWFSLTVALFALVLFAPATMVQDDDALPETGGPALLAPCLARCPIFGGTPSASRRPLRPAEPATVVE